MDKKVLLKDRARNPKAAMAVLTTINFFLLTLSESTPMGIWNREKVIK